MLLNKASEALRIPWCNYDDYVGDDNHDNLIMSLPERKPTKTVLSRYFYVVLIARLLPATSYTTFLQGIQKFGPVHSTWMFPYERFNSWLCRRAMSRKHPEATILRTYQVIFFWYVVLLIQLGKNRITEYRSLNIVQA